jgi:predicted metal-dependent enzyme (double-stranded beta helix superfamily)
VIGPLPGRDLGDAELRTLAAGLAGRPRLWLPHVRHDAERRLFTRLWADDHVTAWLVCWMPGHDTGFHDHDGSSGAVAVVEGTVREDRLRLAGTAVGVGGGTLSRTIAAGGVFGFGGSDIHRVAHAGAAPAVTVHAYSPPLKRMGAYIAAPRGDLQRLVLPEGQELKPLSPPAPAAALPA